MEIVNNHEPKYALGWRYPQFLEGHDSFMSGRKLAPPKLQPHLVQWIRQSLLFAEKQHYCAFDGAMRDKQ